MDGLDFSLEDEETLEMFAAQAATAITNARRYGDEQRAKADQAALVETSPVGVVVVDAKSREIVQSNEESRRMTGGMDLQNQNFEQVVSLLNARRIGRTGDFPR